MTDALAERALEQALACIGCNDCLLACPIPESRNVSIAELNAAVHARTLAPGVVADFVSQCTQCQQCVPVCPADLHRADMVLFNKMKVEDKVEDHELLLQAHTVTFPSGWRLDTLARSLTELELFQGTSFVGMRRVLLYSTLRLLVAGESLCHEGEFHERLCVVLSGAVEQTSRGPRGEHIPILTLGPGSFFGEMGVLADSAEPFGVVAKETAIVLQTPKAAVQRLMNQEPAFAQTLDGLYRQRALWNYARNPGALGILPEAARVELFRAASLELFNSDERVVDAGSSPDNVFLMKSGFLRAVQHTASGTRVPVYFREGDVFGLLPLLHGSPVYGYGVNAATRTEVIRIPSSHVRAVLSRYPDAWHALGRGNFEAERLALFRPDSQPSAGSARHGVGAQQPSHDVLVEQGIKGGREVLVVDQTICTSCGNCMDACERRHGYGRLELRGLQVEQFLFPTACRHCEDPACLLCGIGGIARQPSGEIQIVTDVCIGCGACAERCPYGNISLHPVERPRKGPLERLRELLFGNSRFAPQRAVQDPKVQRIAVKCDLCAGYSDYACVTACPVAAAFRVDPSIFGMLGQGKSKGTLT